ncbi:hypothetical protein ACFQV8_26370 [Pseudonocardia benzenivorans]
MPERPVRPRRSELATPASNEKMFAKAAASGADLVFLDLEDACAPPSARPPEARPAPRCATSTGAARPGRSG